MNSPKTILICPLNWGLGHASRDIPIIRRLICEGFRIIVAADYPIIKLIKSEFPDIETEYFPGLQITYSSKNSQVTHLLKQLPSAFKWVSREKKHTALLVKKYNPVCIISDNRYGVRHPKIKSIFITHQLMLKMPKKLAWLEKPAHQLIKKLISRFDSCWIPDNPLHDSLAGDLVHKYPFPDNARLIGSLSRFMHQYDDIKDNDNEYDLLIILSGLEPQRTILQKILTEKVIAEDIKTLMITGVLNNETTETEKIKGNLKILPHLKSKELYQLIKKTPYIISRSGYSTIMDLWFLNRNAVLIPTPGQTEQEYLAQIAENSNHVFIRQSEIQKINLREISLKNNGFITQKNDLFDEAIKTIINI